MKRRLLQCTSYELTAHFCDDGKNPSRNDALNNTCKKRRQLVGIPFDNPCRHWVQLTRLVCCLVDETLDSSTVDRFEGVQADLIVDVDEARLISCGCIDERMPSILATNASKNVSAVSSSALVRSFLSRQRTAFTLFHNLIQWLAPTVSYLPIVVLFAGIKLVLAPHLSDPSTAISSCSC